MEFDRHDISFSSAGQPCRGWLYLPAAAGPHPVIVMAHGFGAVKEMGLDRFAERFAQAGYACLVFDYRHFGSSAGEPRQLLHIERKLQDWASAITFARGFDGNRVGLWGTWRSHRTARSSATPRATSTYTWVNPLSVLSPISWISWGGSCRQQAASLLTPVQYFST
jgi:pimeloyl-ACP methyl ester carboxylesterase